MKHACRRLLAVAVALSLLGPSAWAAPSPDKAAPPAPTSFELKIAKQRATVTALNAKLKAEHKKLDATIARMVDVAVSLRDSRQSGIAAVKIKESVAKDLAALIRFYREELERVRRRAESETSPAARALWEQQLAAGSALVEARVDQIVRITESLAVYANETNLANSDDNNINILAAKRADRLADAVREALRKDKERLEKENAALQRELTATTDEAERDEIETTVKANDALLSRRADQLVDTVTGAAGSGRAPTRNTLSDYNRELQKVVKELREDYDSLLVQKHAADKERRALALLEEEQARGK